MQSAKIPQNVKVVIVEDDAHLLEGWKDLFDLLGHELVCFSRSLLALSDPKAIKDCDLFISDYYLPDINGVELIKQVREINPGLPAILLTGSRDRGIVEAVEKIKNCVLLYKPLNIDDIEKQISVLVPSRV